LAGKCCLKPAETLSGIETCTPHSGGCTPVASNRLKPSQGLKPLILSDGENPIIASNRLKPSQGLKLR